jgi:CBS domain-containing protein
MSELQSILERKDATIQLITPDASAHDAASHMSRAHVGALLVFEDDELVGIVSERDIMTRVVLEQRDATTTLVRDIMSQKLACIRNDRSASDAMALMTERRIRHLPVLDGGRVAGVVSIGDLVHWVINQKEFEIVSLREYVSGVYPH